MTVFEMVAVSALASSILTPIALIGYWKGKVDTKIDTLWNVYTSSVITREMQRHNPPVRPSLIIPDDVCRRLDMLKLKANRGKPADIGYLVVRRVTVKRIHEIALNNKVGFGEIVAALVLQKLKR